MGQRHRLIKHGPTTHASNLGQKPGPRNWTKNLGLSPLTWVNNQGQGPTTCAKRMGHKSRPVTWPKKASWQWRNDRPCYAGGGTLGGRNITEFKRKIVRLGSKMDHISANLAFGRREKNIWGYWPRLLARTQAMTPGQ